MCLDNHQYPAMSEDFAACLHMLANAMTRTGNQADIDAANILYVITASNHFHELQIFNEAANAFAAGAIERHGGTHVP